MDQPADFSVTRTDAGQTAALTGDWTAMQMGLADDRLIAALAGAKEVVIDLSAVDRLDTAGAHQILKAGNADHRPARYIARPEVTRLLELVDRAVKSEGTPAVKQRSVHALFERIGHGVVNVGLEAFDTLAFMGHLLVAVGRACANPRKIRWAACTSLFERAGLDALPIVMVTTFFIGAVVGLLGANMLRTFGAEVYVVQLVGVAVLREFSVLITAVLLAGRSGSSFAAEIGAMKMNQEIDAMRVLGVDPFDALVFPRFFALLFSFPLLTFAAAVAGLAGGLVVCWSELGLGPTFFFSRIIDTVGPIHFWVGLSKAPVLAIIIAGIGCHQGMEVGGDVESLGRKVTASVVHAIFATIMIDAIFAIIYMKLDI
jgi:phospholipid/cholesterol/gamma-HCH transport system permease protein